jgi:tetratricopeptide (TPR) repeat protein
MCGKQIPQEGKICLACGASIPEGDDATLLREALSPTDLSDYQQSWEKTTAEILDSINHLKNEILPYHFDTAERDWVEKLSHDNAERDWVEKLDHKLDEAYKQLDELASRRVQDIRLSLFRAIVLQLEGKFAFTMATKRDARGTQWSERAIRAYEKSFAIFAAPQQQPALTPAIVSTFPESYLSLGIAYCYVGRHQEARHPFEQAQAAGDAKTRGLAAEMLQLPELRNTQAKAKTSKTGCLGSVVVLVFIGIILFSLLATKV